MVPPPPRGKLCKVFEGETLGLDLSRLSDGKPQKVEGFCNDKSQSLQNKPFLSEDFGRIFLFRLSKSSTASMFILPAASSDGLWIRRSTARSRMHDLLCQDRKGHA